MGWDRTRLFFGEMRQNQIHFLWDGTGPDSFFVGWDGTGGGSSLNETGPNLRGTGRPILVLRSAYIILWTCSLGLLKGRPANVINLQKIL